jgi:hypothetical protein
MFSPEIVASDAFLEMPISTQALYFHLGMYADDDGFVSPRKVMRIIGVTEDDLKVLLSKKFVLPFESGVIVIKHWRMNNQLRQDRYHETPHLIEKSKLFLRENASYSFNNEGAEPMKIGGWQPNGNQMATESRLGKVSIVPSAKADLRVEEVTRESERVPRNPPKYPFKEKVYACWGTHPKVWDANTKMCISSTNLYEERGLDQIKAAIHFWREHKDEPYCPDCSNPHKLDTNWSALFRFKAKNNL